MSLTKKTSSTPVPPETGGHHLLDGKVVVITASAGTGIGQTTARRCLEEGATVIVSDAHPRRTAETASELSTQFGVEVLGIPCDVTNEEEVTNLYGQTIATYGRIDVAVNNAGLGGTTNLVDMTDEQWLKVLDVTLNGTFRCMRAALKHMYAAGSGSIVNNASVLGWRAQPGQAHYAAAKAGVMALTRCAAAEAAEHNVRINAVSPSLAEHPFLNKVIDQESLDLLRSRELFGRGAETWEVANVIIFLASGYSSYLSGEVISTSSQHP